MGLSTALAEASRALDERVNLRKVHRRLQALAKVLIVATFLEDAIRVLLTFGVQQNSMRIAGWKWAPLHSALPVLSLCVQTSASLLIVLPGRSAPVGCYLLIGWSFFHPFMYSQQSNWEFVLETLTIVGGLCILLSHCLLLAAPQAAHARAATHAKAVGPAATAAASPEASRAHGVNAMGRVLIVSVFLYYAAKTVHGYTRRVLVEVATHDWQTPLAEGLSVLALLYMCWLVVIGLKSRWVALVLAALMFAQGVYAHPFWTYIFSDRMYTMEGVEGMEGFQVDAFTMADHQRYFFFQSMSTVGALLLLVVHGPGKLSVDEQDGPLVLITSHDA